MPSRKVYLTYKRKLSSSINGCGTALPKGSTCTRTLITTPNKDKVQNDEHKLENPQENPLKRYLGCDRCSVGGRLLGCEENCQHDEPYKPINTQDAELLSCGCKGSSMVKHVQTSNRLEIKQQIDGSDVNVMEVSSCKSPVMCLCGGTPGKDVSALPSLDISIENKSPDIQVTSCSAINKDSEEKLVCQMLNTGKSLYIGSSKPSTGIICSSDDDTGLCLLVEPKPEGTDSISEDNVTKLHADSLVQTRCALPAPNISIENISPAVPVTSCSAMNVDTEEKLASQSMLMNTQNSFDAFSSKTSTGRVCSSEDDTGSSLLVEPKPECTDLLSEDNVTKLHGDSLGQTKSASALITFSRRSKRKKYSEEADIKKSLLEQNNSSSESVVNRYSKSLDCSPADKGCCTDGSLKVGAEDAIHSKKDGADSMCVHGESVPDVIFVRDEQQAHGSDSISKGGPPSNSKVLDQSSKFSMDSEESHPSNSIRPFLNDAVNINNDALATNGDSEPVIMPNYRGKGQHPCLDLSVAPHETIRSSTDSTSRSHATVLHEVQPSKFLDGMSERVEESPPVCSTKAFSDASTCVEEVCGNSKDDVEASPPFSSVENAVKLKCLQLFSEQACNDFHHGETEMKVHGCIGMEGRKSLQLGRGNNQTGRASSSSPLDLGLYLPTVPDNGDCSTKRFSNMSQFQNSDGEIRGFIPDAVPQSSSNLSASLMRHKLTLDSIISRTSTLHATGGFQDRSYTTHWSEEELDSLWIGVRRHGRGNWHDILRDPGLLFSSCKVAGDLAERWEKEHAKLVSGSHISQFKSPITHAISLDNNGCFPHPETGNWRGNGCDETKLSLGDVYTRKAGGSAKRRRSNFNSILSNGREHLYSPGNMLSDFHGELYGKRSFDYFSSIAVPRCDTPPTSVASSLGKSSNLPMWLVEAINTPLPRPSETTLPSVFPPIAHSEIMQGLKTPQELGEYNYGPRNRILGEFGGLRASDLQPTGSMYQSNMPKGMRCGITGANMGSLYHVNKPNEVIIIDSDASSEETISDDHIGSRPKHND